MTALLIRDAAQFDLLAAVQAIEATPGLKLRARAPLRPSLAEADVESVTVDADGTATLVTGAFSFFGPNGPLPAPLAEAASRRPHAADFFDLFGNHIFGLFIDIAKLEMPTTAGAPATTAQGRAIRALIGRAAGAPNPPPTVRAMMGLAGLLNQRPVSVHAVERAFAALFETPAKVRPLVGGWSAFPEDDRTMIASRGAGTALGGSSIGRRAWLQDAGVELTLGPMDESRFRSLLPDGDAHGAVQELAAAALPTSCEVTLRLVVEAAETPETRLDAARRPQLGWTSFLVSQPRASDGAVTLRPATIRPATIPAAL